MIVTLAAVALMAFAFLCYWLMPPKEARCRST